MVDIVAPKRGEPVVDADGIPNTRFVRYLESSTDVSNLSAANIGDAQTSLGTLDFRTTTLELTENTPVIALIIELQNTNTDLQRQIDDLNILVNI